MSLRSYCSKLSKDKINCKVSIAALMIKKLARSLYKLHSERIIHRDVCMENIAVKVSKEDQVKLQIANFDFAFCFD